MAKKQKSYWTPDAKGHLAAAHTLSKAAPHLAKSAPVVQRKLASFRAAAKLAKAAKTKVPKPAAAQPMTQPPHLAPPSNLPPTAKKLSTALPPSLPTTPV